MAIMDLEKDGQIDRADVTAWLASAATENRFASPYLRGDANLDGVVDAANLNVLAVHWRRDDAAR